MTLDKALEVSPELKKYYDDDPRVKRLLDMDQEKQNRLDNVLELKSSIEQYGRETDAPTLAGFLEGLSLVSDVDTYDPDADAVSMMTMHSAKGLEFPVVFVCGMDYGKFRFEQAKKEKEARKNQKIVDIKEVRLSSKIDVHDYEVRVKAAKKFLEDGDKVKAAIRFRGREMAHTEIGLTVMQRFAESVAEFGTVEKPAKLEGRQMLMFIAPLKTK